MIARSSVGKDPRSFCSTARLLAMVKSCASRAAKKRLPVTLNCTMNYRICMKIINTDRHQIVTNKAMKTIV